MPDSFIYLSGFKGVLRGGDIAFKGTWKLKGGGSLASLEKGYFPFTVTVYSPFRLSGSVLNSGRFI